MIFKKKSNKEFVFTPEEQKVMDKCEKYTPIIPTPDITPLYKKVLENEKRYYFNMKNQKLIDDKLKEIKLEKLFKKYCDN